MSATRLHLAAFDGNNDLVNQLLADGAEVDCRTGEGETPLLFAATQGHTATVRTLLKYGADVNALPTSGQSPLRRAIRGGHAEIVQLLLQRGADPNAAPPPEVVTPEEKARFREQMRERREKRRKAGASFGIEVEGKRDDIFDRLFSDESAPKPESEPESGEFRCVMLAIGSRDEATLKTILEAGYSPNPPKKGGSIPLNFARSTGAGLSIVRLLLQYGADPNVDSEVPLLMSAIMQGDIPFAELLLDAGARPEGGGCHAPFTNAHNTPF